MPQNNKTEVLTGKCRLSYAHLFQPYTSDPDENEPRYSVVLLIPKGDKKTLDSIKKAQLAALEVGVERGLWKSIPKGWSNTLRDGDDDPKIDSDKNPEYEGHYFMNVSSKTRPAVADRSAHPVIDESEVYSGCFARAKINCFPYSVKGNRGVSFGLNGIQKLGDGEPLGAVAMKAEDFEALDDEDDEDGEGLI